jgi:hypothetical protein
MLIWIHEMHSVNVSHSNRVHIGRQTCDIKEF